jgi:hypothetical protein
MKRAWRVEKGSARLRSELEVEALKDEDEE